MNIRKNYSLINYNSFGVNVKAKEFIEINSNAELLTLKEIIKNKKVLFLGGGSNILSVSYTHLTLPTIYSV